jgi:tRNA(Arg) A34 adenosine deaminase TadA
MILSIKEQSFINSAVKEASSSDCLRMHGCVVVSHGKIIGKGCNHHRPSSTSDKFMVNQCTCHAEISALREAYTINGSVLTLPYINKFKKITLYVVRVNTKGDLKNSAPCVHCTEVIVKLNIKRVVYSGGDNTFTKMKPSEYYTNYTSIGNRT